MKRFWIVTFALSTVLWSTQLLAQDTQGRLGQAIVSAETKDGAPAPVGRGDVTLTSRGKSLEIVDWIPAQGEHAGLDLYLVLDDSSRTTLGTQFSELKQFIQSLPPTTNLAIGYMRNGTVSNVQPLGADHAAAAAKLRLPLGVPGIDSSPYFSLRDLARHWPGSAPRREILMVTDGVDRYYGNGPDDPYVSEAIDACVKAGVVVSSIYFESAGHFGHNPFLLNWGQNYLGQVALDTGGEAYWYGIGNPVSFQPYLRDMAKRLEHQYLLTFRDPGAAKTGTIPIKVRTEVPGVELVGPRQVELR